MSFQAMAWAVSQKLPTKEKFVLIMMANYADEDGKCWPSMNRLCEDTGMKKDSVIRAIKSLEEMGLAEVERRKIEGVNLPNIYHLNLRGVVADSDQGVVAHSEDGSRSQRLKPIIEPITRDSIVGFEKFWLACPRRIGKEAARKAYEKARKTTSDSELLEGMRRYAATRAGQDEQYTVHPATWLNQGRWADEPAEGYAQGQGQKREMTEDEKWEAARRFHEFWENKERMEAKNG
jgi:DNA-binding transcriptional regulator YhcF (GntR family)